MRYQSIILLSRAARVICLRESDDEFFVSIKFLRDFQAVLRLEHVQITTVN